MTTNKYILISFSSSNAFIVDELPKNYYRMAF